MKKAFQAAVLLVATGVSAMEFGVMGSQAFGMAGTGVAVSKSPWGLYYNPALIALDSGFKIGAYADIRGKSKNFFEVLDLDLQGMSGKPATIGLTEYEKLKDLLKDNHVSISNQDGLVLQLPDFGIGALAVGGFARLNAQGSIQAQNLPSLQKAQDTIKDNFGLQADFSALALIEVPVGYAYNFDTNAGDFSVGVAVKYLNLSSVNTQVQIDGSVDAQNILQKLPQVDFGYNASNIGVDVGLAYEVADLFTLGVVGKNLNAPSFEIGTKKYSIDPQVRAGAALNIGFWNLAFDADLMANKLLGSEIQNQMISLGTSLDFKFLSLRAGVAKDLKQKDDLIFALGLGLAFFDVGVQFGKKTSPINGKQIPDYLAIQLGAGFSF